METNEQRSALRYLLPAVKILFLHSFILLGRSRHCDLLTVKQEVANASISERLQGCSVFLPVWVKKLPDGGSAGKNFTHLPELVKMVYSFREPDRIYFTRIVSQKLKGKSKGNELKLQNFAPAAG